MTGSITADGGRDDAAAFRAHHDAGPHTEEPDHDVPHVPVQRGGRRHAQRLALRPLSHQSHRRGGPDHGRGHRRENPRAHQRAGPGHLRRSAPGRPVADSRLSATGTAPRWASRSAMPAARRGARPRLTAPSSRWAPAPFPSTPTGIPPTPSLRRRSTAWWRHSGGPPALPGRRLRRGGDPRRPRLPHQRVPLAPGQPPHG